MPGTDIAYAATPVVCCSTIVYDSYPLVLLSSMLIRLVLVSRMLLPLVVLTLLYAVPTGTNLAYAATTPRIWY
eukprot:1823675-Rhodomonas_salina.3